MADSLLSEIALTGSEHLDPAYVAGYDRKARFDPQADLDALRAQGLHFESTLIDFGAGTGTFALAASALCKRVIAVDVSTPMVEAIKTKVAELAPRTSNACGREGKSLSGGWGTACAPWNAPTPGPRLLVRQRRLRSRHRDLAAVRRR
jgi:SAM-dependent methyltransferase